MYDKPRVLKSNVSGHKVQIKQVSVNTTQYIPFLGYVLQMATVRERLEPRRNGYLLVKHWPPYKDTSGFLWSWTLLHCHHFTFHSRQADELLGLEASAAPADPDVRAGYDSQVSSFSRAQTLFWPRPRKSPFYSNNDNLKIGFALSLTALILLTRYLLETDRQKCIQIWFWLVKISEKELNFKYLPIKRA